MEKEQLINFLNEKIGEIDKLKSQELFSSEFLAWKNNIIRILSRAFREADQHMKHFESISYEPPGIINKIDTLPEKEDYEAFEKGLSTAKATLKGIVDEIEKFEMPSKEQKNVKNSDSENTFNITQNQSMNVNVETVLKNNLDVLQFEELNKILKESNKETKENRIIEFLKKVGEKVLVEIVKSLLI